VKPDLVFMDVVLQEAFGDDLAPLLRMRGFECPILLMSSLPDEELDQRSTDAGLDGFVSKRGGLAEMVARARKLLGDGVAASTGSGVVGRFEITSHQRLRRVMHVAAAPKHWNAPSIAAEMHALAGDADLAGAPAIADAARACRDATQQFGSSGPTVEIKATIDTLAELVGGGMVVGGKLLVVDPTDFCRDTLLPGLDRAGHVVVEARTLAEARQKLHAAEYDLIIVDGNLKREQPTLIPELEGYMPNVQLAILSEHPDPGTVLHKHLGAERLIEEIERLLPRRA
jgi:DNA-binding response OmpR family regulator